MGWTVVLATVIGAGIGVGSTLAADRIRWRRETAERERDQLRTACADYLVALAEARDGISWASRDPATPPDGRAEQARTAFAGQAVYAKLYILQLIAPEALVVLAGRASERLTRYRDAVSDGALRDDPACTEARRAFREARRALMAEM
ncbi:hypothetical protein ACWDR0_02980 [Streptomyces sp. NPDC003691]